MGKFKEINTVRKARPTMVELAAAVLDHCPGAVILSKDAMYREALKYYHECMPTLESGLVYEWMCTCFVCIGQGIFYYEPEFDNEPYKRYKFQYGTDEHDYSSTMVQVPRK